MKFVPNIAVLESKKPQVAQNNSKSPQKSAKPAEKADSPARKISNQKQGNFSIDQIKLGESYEGYVKLTYNYGIFVTVKGIEGLLHKKQIKTPDNVDWKKYYNI